MSKSSAWTNIYGGGTVIPADPSYIPYTITVDNNPLILTWPDSYIAGVNNSVASALNIQTALVDSAEVLMPDAKQASPGFTIIIQNIGAENITVNTALGDFLITIEPTQAIYFQITDNTTIEGEWNLITFGAGSSSANAADLAGLGLIAFSSKLNTQLPVTNVSTTFSPTVNDRAKFFIYNGGTGSCILPDPSTTNIGDGYFFAVSNTSIIGGILTIVNTHGYIDVPGETTLIITPGTSTNLISDGAGNYFTLGIGTETFFTYAAIDINISGTGSIDLTAEQATRQIINFVGTLTGSRSVVFPNFIYEWQIANLTSGAFPLTVEANGGSNIIPLVQGERYIISNDGTDMFSYPTTASALGNLTYILQTANAILAPNAQSLGTLTTGLLKNTVANSSGTLSTATPGTDYLKNPVPNIQFAVNGTIPTPVANTMFMQLNEQSNFAFISTIGTLNLLFNDANNNFIFATPSALTTGQGNTIINPYSALALGTGSNNTIMGHTSGASLSTSNATTIIGAFAGQTVTNITNGALFGYGATFSSDNLTNATAIGSEAAVNASNTLVLGNGANVAIGAPTAPYALSLQNNNGTQAALWLSTNATPPAAPANGIVLSANTNNNLLFTYSDHSLDFYSDTKSNAVLGLVPNINVGGGAMTNLLWGGNTTYAITTGFNNVGTGFGAGVAITTGSYNVLSGVDALADTTTGANNVAVGSSSGRGHDGQNNCVFIGGNTLVGAANLTNAIAIGYGSVISSSNAMLLGNGANVLIGSGTTPAAPESLNLLSANGSAGLYFATSPDTRTAGGRSGGVFSVDANDIPRYTSLAIAGGNNSANIDTYPQPYYQCTATIGTNVGPTPGTTDLLPFAPGATLTGILNNGYPGGYYPNAVLTLEFGYNISGGTPGDFLFSLQLTKVVAGTPTTYNGVPSTPQYAFTNPGSGENVPYRLTANVLLSDIVDANATSWAIAINNDVTSADFIVVTQATSLVNAYIITGGVN